MASSIGVAVDVAERLPDIHFPEFTAKLLTDTFDAIVSANLRQTESYIELLQAVSKTLNDYISDTKDRIGGAEVLEFLETALPATPSIPGPRVAVGQPLSSTEQSTLTARLKLPGQTNPPTITIQDPNHLSDTELQQITDLVAQRLAADKYTLLKEMVKMGVLRMIITEGLVKTQLTFSTWASSFYQTRSATYNTQDFNLNASAKTGTALSRWFSAAATTKFTTVKVRTSSELQQDHSGTAVNIFGQVEIHFKTDYQPLNP
jgi:hypothetical protein